MIDIVTSFGGVHAQMPLAVSVAPERGTCCK
jgi:hypothetical protein